MKTNQLTVIGNGIQIPFLTRGMECFRHFEIDPRVKSNPRLRTPGLRAESGTGRHAECGVEAIMSGEETGSVVMAAFQDDRPASSS
jgi:hypothetical protein